MDTDMVSTISVADDKPPDDEPSRGGEPFPDNKPFPFLRLPKELRLMVYDRLPIVTRHDTQLKRWPKKTDGINRTMTIVTKTVPGVAILATCRVINSEASPIIAKKFEDIRSQPTRYIIDPECIAYFSRWRFGILLLVTDIISGDCSRWNKYVRDWADDSEFTGPPSVEFVEKWANWELKGRLASRDIDTRVEIAINIGGLPDTLSSDRTLQISQAMLSLPWALRYSRKEFSRMCPKRTVHALIKFSSPTPKRWEQDLARTESGSTPGTVLPVVSEDGWRHDWAEGAESL